MNKLRVAREFCFQYFFHMQLPVFKELRETLITNNDQAEIFNSIESFKASTNTLLEDDINATILNRVLGTLRHYNEIEIIVQKHLKKWKLARLSKVDHTNLLLSTYELCFDKTIPVGIVINEAVEISKKFGSQESPSFINGVLDSIAKNQ